MTHKEWNPQDVLAALDTELRVNEDMDHRDVARRKFRDAVALVADRITHIAIYGENDALAFKAGTYVMDRVFGRVSDTPMGAAKEDELTTLVRDLYESEGVTS